MESAKMKRSPRHVLVVSIFLGLSGCMVGPEYTKPTVEAPDGWTTLRHPVVDGNEKGADGTLTAKRVDVTSWWECFNDPMLCELVEKAVRSNHDLKLAEARLREARAAHGISKAALYPQVEGGAGFNRQQISENSPDGYLSDLNYSDYKAGFDASWEIDIWGRVRREKQATKAEDEAALENLRSALVAVVGEVSRNYIELRGFQRRLEIAEKNMAAGRKRLMLVEKRFQAGFASEVDVHRASAHLAAITAEVPVIEGGIRQRMYSISTLLGELPGTYVERLSTEEPVPPVPATVEIGLPIALLERRPDIREAERRLAAATARVGSAKAEMLPKLSLSALFSFETVTFDRITDSDSHAWSFGPSFILPVFNAGRIRSNINVKTAQQEQALIEYEKTVLAAYQEVEDSLVRYGTRQHRHEKLNRRADNLHSALDLTQKLYDKGSSSLLEVLDAQQEFFAAQDELIESEAVLSVQLVSLYKALGGGWGKGTDL